MSARARGKRKAAAVVEEDEEDEQDVVADEEEEGQEVDFPCFSQAAPFGGASEVDYTQHDEDSTTKATERANQLPTAVQQNITNDLIRYFLFKGSSGDAIKMPDVTKDVLKKYTLPANTGHIFMSRAKKRLLSIWGCNLKQTPFHVLDGKYKNVYFLVNEVKPNAAVHKRIKLQVHDGQTRGLIFSIAALIECNGAAIEEVQLAKQLSSLDCGVQNEQLLANKTQRHGLFGSLRVALDKLCNQLYFVKQSERQDMGTPRVTYEIGPHFLMTIGRLQLVTAMSELLGQPLDPQTVKEIKDSEKDPHQ